MRTLIIDDYAPNRKRLKDLVERYCPEVTVIGEADGVQSGFEAIEKTQPELLLLDIEMDDGTGFDLLTLCKSYAFKVIFITAHDHYALKAFRFSAVDYILKPIDLDDLQKAISKTKEQAKQSKLRLDTLLENQNTPQKLVLSDADTIYLVDINKIIRCQSQNNYTQFYLSDGREILITKTLKDYESLLADQYFFRAHRSHLINLQHFDKFDKRDGGIIYMKDGSMVPVSNQKREVLMHALRVMP